MATDSEDVLQILYEEHLNSFLGREEEIEQTFIDSLKLRLQNAGGITINSEGWNLFVAQQKTIKSLQEKLQRKVQEKNLLVIKFGKERAFLKESCKLQIKSYLDAIAKTSGFILKDENYDGLLSHIQQIQDNRSLSARKISYLEAVLTQLTEFSTESGRPVPRRVQRKIKHQCEYCKRNFSSKSYLKVHSQNNICEYGRRKRKQIRKSRN